MAFTTGTSSSIDDLLTQLVSFAVTNAGFTNVGQVTSSAGTGSRTVHRVSKGGIHWFFVRETGNNGFRGRLSYSALADGGNIDSPGTAFQTYPTLCHTWGFTPPFVGHYFFTDGTCVHAAIEVASGVFNHFSFGSITKYGTWTGGEYITGGYYGSSTAGEYRGWNSSYNHRVFNDQTHSQLSTIFSYLRVKGDASTNADFGTLYSGYDGSNGMFCGAEGGSNRGNGSIYTRLLANSPNQMTSRTAIFPGLVRVADYTEGSNLGRVAGIVPYVGILKFSEEMLAKDIINTDWQVFPITVRTGGSTSTTGGAANSGEYALAYRRV